MFDTDSVLKMILSRRTIRQFKQDPIPIEYLEKCIEAARFAPSASNLQPLEFFLIIDAEKVKEVFPMLKWAAYISPKGNPQEGRKPTAYLALLVNKSIRETGAEYDVGAAVENFILSAWSFGIGSCWMVSVDRIRFRDVFNVPQEYIIDSIVALGYPDESPVVETADKNIRYWKDNNGILHVPKRPLKDILHINSL